MRKFVVVFNKQENKKHFEQQTFFPLQHTLDKLASSIIIIGPISSPMFIGIIIIIIGHSIAQTHTLAAPI